MIGPLDALDGHHRLVLDAFRPGGANYQLFLDIAGNPTIPGKSKRHHLGACQSLIAGDIYYVAGDARPHLDAAARAYPLETPLTVDALAGAYRGFAWLRDPLPSRSTYDRRVVHIRAISWTVGVREDAAPPEQTLRFGTGEDQYVLVGADATPENITCLIIGLFIDHPARPGHPPVIGLAAQINIGSSLAVLQREDPDESYLEGLRFALTFLSFIRQRVIVAPRQRADRATARRIARDAPGKPVPEVRVVTLRAAAPREHEEPLAGRDVQWTCHWEVRGFWRDQYYPSLGQHRPVWIATHLRGPRELPFRARRIVRAVTR